MGVKIRVAIAGLFGLSSVLCIGSFVDTQVAEACGVKVAVKAAPSKRNVKRVSKRKRPLDQGSRVAVRRRVGAQDDRQPVRAGSDRQARRRPIDKTSRDRGKVEPRKRVERKKPKKTNEVAAKKPEKKPEKKPAVKKKSETRVAAVEKAEKKPAVEKTEVPSDETETTPAREPDSAASVEVYFGVGAAIVSDESKDALQDIVEWLKDNPKGRLVVEGHADPAGPAALNMRLSLQRARAVRAFLIEATGASKRQITVKARGESRLKYERDSDQNRRVSVTPR